MAARAALDLAMKGFKGILLPLAVLLAGVVVFDLGARYGAANVRAIGIAAELALPVNLYVQTDGSLEPTQRENLEFLIDHRIAAGALHRNIWYLGRRATDALDKVLAYALSVRGEGAVRRFDPDEAELAKIRQENGEAAAKEALERMAELRAAVAQAKRELAVEASEGPAAEAAPASVDDLVKPVEVGE